uniref:Uncharacterized protein n=1 Tax=Arundo donax TaxID=35708 RepID=A0A0A8ZQX5_ARUDO
MPREPFPAYLLRKQLIIKLSLCSNRNVRNQSR